MTGTSLGQIPEATSAGSDPLTSLEGNIQRAVEFAEQWPEPYKAAVFQLALGRLVRGLAVGGTTSASPVSEDVRDGAAEPVRETPLSRLATVLNLPPELLARVVDFPGDGRVRIIGRLDGASVRELQTRYSVVYCYIKEKALGEQQVDIEELRQLCMTHGCYDQANFTAYFRRDDLLREVGSKGSREKRYLASRRGLDEAERIIRHMVES